MRPVCFHQPCKIDPVNRAGSLDIGEQKGSLFGALCDDIESVIGPLHAFDFKAGSVSSMGTFKVQRQAGSVVHFASAIYK